MNMEIKLGLHSVTNFIAYHISTQQLAIGDKYDTSDIERVYDDCCDKKCIETLTEKYRESVQFALRTNLPSRLTSLFVCEKEYVNYWHTHMVKYRRTDAYKIYKLRLNGQLLGTYADYLKMDKYWRPNEQLPLQEKEGLFRGVYIVEDICNIDFFEH